MLRPRSLVYLLFVTTFLAGCLMPGISGIPLAQVPGSSYESLRPPLFQAPPDATATPTPFQPIPPTPSFLPTQPPTETPLPSPTLPPPQDSGPSSSLERPRGLVNILLLGSDQRPWWGSRYFRTDTIILASINPSQGTVSLVSFPRDLFVTIPGYGQDRINTAYERGGFNKLAATLEYNFGVQVDHYVLIDFSNFKRIVDSLGGLEVEVGETLSDYYRGRYITIKPGVRKMNADMVLWYVRSRKTSNDFARNRRQQEVLKALVVKFLSLNAVARAPELYAIYKDSVTTDMSLKDMLTLLPVAAQLGESGHIRHYFIGPKQVSNWITPGGAMVLLPNREKIIKVLRQAQSGQ
jgi:LCP family protein required for cell wall assembly